MTIKRKFTEFMAEEIRTRRAHGMKLDELSWKYHCSMYTISMVLARKGAYAKTYCKYDKFDRNRV